MIIALNTQDPVIRVCLHLRLYPMHRQVNFILLIYDVLSSVALTIMSCPSVFGHVIGILARMSNLVNSSKGVGRLVPHQANKRRILGTGSQAYIRNWSVSAPEELFILRR